MGEERDNSDIHLQVKRLSLIDFSSENDALVLGSSSPPLTSTGAALEHCQFKENVTPAELFESLGGSLSNGKEAGLTPSSEQDDKFSFLKESSEPDSVRKKAKCNLRKSLAWDSAFFTSAGVLDPEELSCMIKGAEKSEKKVLPGIEEDFRRSTDSVSTLESDNLVLENLEAELFEDIRISIQKSSKAFTATSETCKAASGESQAIPSKKKKMSVSSQNQKQQPAFKKPIGISKSQMKQILTAQGTAREVKQDAVRSRVVQPLVRTGNSNPTLPKPPRVISKGKSTPTLTAKKASNAASEARKTEHNKTTFGTVAGKVSQASKTHVVSGARRVLPKSALSSKASSFDSSNSTKSSTSSLNDSSGSVSSENVGKVHLAPNQRKVGDRIVNPPFSSTLKTPSKTSRNRTISGNSSVSEYLMSSKISSSVSPASSISEWSSASSSSSCTINHRFKSRASFETSSCRSSENDTFTSDLNDHYNGKMLEKHKDEEMSIPNRNARKSSTQTTLSRPDSAKPSGLRMPSPKIGFFDGVKAVRTPTGSLQSNASLMVLPKVGAAVPSPSRSSNMKPKIGRLSHSRTVSALAKTNPQERRSLVSFSEKLQPSVNVNSDASDLEGCRILPFEVTEEMNGESCLKAEEIEGEVPRQANNVESTGFGVVMNGNDLPFIMTERSWDMDRVISSKDNQVVATGDTFEPNAGKWESLKPLEKVDRDG